MRMFDKSHQSCQACLLPCLSLNSSGLLAAALMAGQPSAYVDQHPSCYILQVVVIVKSIDYMDSMSGSQATIALIIRPTSSHAGAAYAVGWAQWAGRANGHIKSLAHCAWAAALSAVPHVAANFTGACSHMLTTRRSVQMRPSPMWRGGYRS